MAESHYERAVTAFATALAAIHAGEVYDQLTGAAYHFDVDHVLRWPALTPEVLNTSLTTVFVVSEDDTTIDDANGTLPIERARITLDLSLLHRFTDIERDPYSAPAVARGTVQSRLVQDAQGCIMAQNRGDKLGGLVTWIHTKLETRSADKTYVETIPWACAILRIEMDCFYRDTNP